MTATALRAEEQSVAYLVAPPLTEHLDTFASAPEGFKRLRQLVLNLAVRGRLVPQDPNDEPAEKLLEKIRLAGAKAVLTPEEPAPYELPSAWVWTTLGEATNVGETIKAGTLHQDTWVLDLEDIEKDTSRVTRKIHFAERQSKSDKNVFAAGDVLYGKLRPYLNKVIVADESGVCTTEILPLRGYESIDPNYIKTFLKSPSFIDYVNAKSYGMKMPRLGTTDARKAHFALPPLAEQSRIVAKVEELMALIDRLEAKVGAGDTARGKLLDTLLAALAASPDAAATADAWAQLAPHFDLLLRAPADVDRLQQTLLALAVKGRLVPQDPNDEPAAELLKRIRAEKDRLIAAGKLKRDKPLPAVGNDEMPCALPNGWQWVRFGDLFLVAGGVTLGRKLTGKRTVAYPYLRVANVQRGGLDLRQIKEVEIAEDELDRYSLKQDDLLITEGGDWDKVGRTAIWDCQIEPCLHQNHVFRARRIVGDMNIALVASCMNSPVAMAYFQESAKQTTNLASINMGELKNCPIPLPPLPEQSRIVAAVASLTTLCDRLRERLAARRELSAKLAAALTESALA